ncbi:MAG: xanthan lyase [Candidatus Marinimicrobia bacterium]|nr:xanthan lyase [Candidatus Neomarinimicrobiota bacterium]MBT3632019.1 xanthan lyase [Candidatus Neomarinimicrobiota bacterium]MBT3824605.1 xanthan lyase [Candidatus Neomarinimicrobiota bacterium]MBT4130221.1 xanthan lyase [Candidatus Neomarinimicrobiota bacterium]MBT4296971.1 xanthan lyase [Candidatus Neomarinimicrobiota bacterium]
MSISQKFLTLLFVSFLITCTSSKPGKTRYDYSNMDRVTRKAHQSVEQFLDSSTKEDSHLRLDKYTRIDTIIINSDSKQIEVHFSRNFANIPVREKLVKDIHLSLKASLGRKFKDYNLKIYSVDHEIEALVPNYFRGSKRSYDQSRMPAPEIRSLPLVRNLSHKWQPSAGLYNRNIALWHSHGWYYEQKLQRWEWQRARVFQTVEDLLPMSFTLNYLVPMLENAGAQVFMPRERDLQTNEVIIDNNTPDVKQGYQEYDSKLHKWETSAESGFAIGTPPYASGDNPFFMGTSRNIKADTSGSAKIRWIPSLPEAGKYAVYITYSAADSNVTDAHYTVFHTGGQTEFLVNQQIGGKTWIYLGTFDFNQALNADIHRVELTNKSTESGRYVSADAIRFGGGIGNIAREGQVSGRPRFTEAARYYLQYAGMPDTLVYNLNADESDYKDDYQCRAEWVNYLRGAPFGPNLDRQAPGLKIPIDLSFAFHTDAGFTRNDTVVGTLSIYSTEDSEETEIFPDSMSRMTNRDLADILQTQIVNDIRAKYDPTWTRRMLWDRGYSEAYRPNVPSVLLELLSHHNFLDMKFANDPRFKFDASRSIYKAMVRYISTQWNLEYVIQPLPVSHFQATFAETGELNLQWQAVEDPLESTATPEKYMVYTRVEDEGFDNGIVVDAPHLDITNLEEGIIYSYKVTALNAGGESFPSEILSVCNMGGDKAPVLIVNAFDRISAASTIETDKYLGFVDLWDEGVADGFDINYIGSQYDLLAASPWLDDDEPGHGASYGDMETTLIPGNSFDFPHFHGKSLREAGYSFVSSSDEAIWSGQLDINKYTLLDLIFGEEKEVSGPKDFSPRDFRGFPKSFQEKISAYTQSGGNLFLSGAYVGFDLFDNENDSLDMQFGEDILKYKFRTDHAVKTGKLSVVTQDIFQMETVQDLEFNTRYHPSLYKVESPDAIEPATPEAHTILRYAENNTSAAIAATGETNIVVFGFPFESILSKTNRDKVMASVLKFLDSK